MRGVHGKYMLCMLEKYMLYEFGKYMLYERAVDGAQPPCGHFIRRDQCAFAWNLHRS